MNTALALSAPFFFLFCLSDATFRTASAPDTRAMATAAPRTRAQAHDSPLERVLPPNVFASLVLPCLDYRTIRALRATGRYGCDATNDPEHFLNRIRERWGDPATCDEFDTNPRRVYVNLSRAAETVRAFHCLKLAYGERRRRVIERRRRAVEYIFKHVLLLKTCVSTEKAYAFARSSWVDEETRVEVIPCDACATNYGVPRVGTAPNENDYGLLQVVHDWPRELGFARFEWHELDDYGGPENGVECAQELIRDECAIIKMCWLLREFVVRRARGDLKADLNESIVRTWIGQSFQNALADLCYRCEVTENQLVSFVRIRQPGPLRAVELSELEDKALWAARKFGMSAEMCHWIVAMAIGAYELGEKGWEDLYPPRRLAHGPYACGGRPTANVNRRALAASPSTPHAIDGKWVGYRVYCHGSHMAHDLASNRNADVRLELDDEDMNELLGPVVVPKVFGTGKNEQFFFFITILVPPDYKPGLLKHDVSINPLSLPQEILTKQSKESPRYSEADKYDVRRQYAYESRDDRKITAQCRDALGNADLSGIIYHDSAYGEDFPRILLHGHYDKDHHLQGSTLTFFGSISPTGISGYFTVDDEGPHELFTMWAE
jgi:hypothetical protein